MYKIIACDLDETLLKTDRSINEIDKKAIAKATELGVKFVPSSGRGFRTIQGTLRDLDLFGKENEYLISFNGGAITENKENQLLHFEGIDFDLCERIFIEAKKYDVGLHVYTKDVVYCINIDDNERAYLNNRMEVEEVEWDDLSALRGQELVKIIYVNTNYDYLRSIAEELKPMTADCAVSYSSNRYLEFNKKGVTKGNALRILAERLGVDIKDTIAIGDNFNDLSMIEAAGLGVGVQNTISDMKPLCDVITDRTNNEGAVAEVIEKYILNCK